MDGRLVVDGLNLRLDIRVEFSFVCHVSESIKRCSVISIVGYDGMEQKGF